MNIDNDSLSHKASADQIKLDQFLADGALEYLALAQVLKRHALRVGEFDAAAFLNSENATRLMAESAIDNFQVNMRQELVDLGDRVFRLEAYLEHRNNELLANMSNEIQTTATYELELIKSQLDAMRGYYSALATRIEREERYLSYTVSDRVNELATKAPVPDPAPLAVVDDQSDDPGSVD